MTDKKCTAIVLAAGSGSRMQSSVAKQYMLLQGKPLIWYALQTVEKSKIIDDCILVTGEEDIEFVRAEIVEKYDFQKVRTIIAGGAERYASVMKALNYMENSYKEKTGDYTDYIFIHDGARPFLTEEILQRTYEAVQQYGACVAAMLSKDTVKIADEEEFAVSTPERRLVWSIQTPQVFDAKLIMDVYGQLQKYLTKFPAKRTPVTDDASVVELFTDKKVKLVEGSYKNIKITTPEDMKIAEAFLKE